MEDDVTEIFSNDEHRSQFAGSGSNFGERAGAGGRMQAWFATASGCQREMVDFISNRLAKDSNTMREMIGCRNPTDAMDIHMRWAQEMIRDYGAEMTKLVAITTRHADEAAQRRH
jgi:hypothetical protein